MKTRKRRGKGEGSITYIAKSKLYQGAISTPEGRKYAWAKTEAACIAQVRKMQRNIDQGQPAVPSKQSLGPFLQTWLSDVVRTSTRPRVHHRYAELVKLHIAPTLGKTQLARLTPQHVHRLYNAKLETLSPGSVRHIHEVLHNALETALRWGLVGRNVCDAVRPPRVIREEPVPLTPDQARSMVAAIREDPWGALYVLAITTGLRQSEILGLKWGDLDLEDQTLQVRRNIQRVPGLGLVEGEPKSRSSRRTVALTHLAIAALRRHRARQNATRLAAGDLWNNLDLVFPNSIGRPLEAGRLLKLYKAMLTLAALPPIHFHGLRHSAASLLIALGADARTVQEIMGHSHVSTTLGIYTHTLPDSQRLAVARLGQLLTPSDE